MDQASALTTLNTILGDSSNITFSTDEKNRAINKAWNDSWVVKIVWDSTLTYTQGEYQYALPDGVTAIKDIYIAQNSSQPMPEPLTNDLWEVVGSNIQFWPNADRYLRTGDVLYIKANYKLASTDSIDSADLQEYVLALAGVNTLSLLAHKKANLFIKNDTTMGELIGLRREFMNDVKELRARLAREYESA